MLYADKGVVWNLDFRLRTRLWTGVWTQ